MANLVRGIKRIRQSVIAIGFRPDPQRITIIGSGFAVTDDGKILSSADLYKQLKPGQIANLMGMALVKQEENGLEHFQWFPLKLIRKEDQNDMALFQIEDYEKMLLQPLELGNSDKVEVGEEVYFIGFPYAAQLIKDRFGVTRIVNRAIISNVKRDGTDPNRKRNWFIVDAISNPGNSGCPLISAETNKVIGVMAISFRTRSKTHEGLDIREPMHIAGARPINLAKPLLENL